MTAPASLPNWEGFLLPILEVSAADSTRTRRELFIVVADHMALSPEQRAEKLNSGEYRAVNRMGWATSFLVRADALRRPQRGSYVITDGGRALLAQHPGGLTEKDLRAVSAFRDYVAAPPKGAKDSKSQTAEASLDPKEQIEAGMERLKGDVAADLLDRLRNQDPAFLERSVLKVLMQMGYGGPDGKSRHIGGTGDGGVDGVIDQDKLGLQQLYVQAKRYAVDNTVGREAIQAFVGALHGRNVSNGVFITTSKFSQSAKEYADGVSTRVVLIDGQRLAELMIAYGVGVQTVDTLRVVQLDEDYFD